MLFRSEAQAPATVVYLVRHAERAEDGSSDPVISLAGWDRSRLLARMLADASIDRIHTTDYRRTRQTVGPLAETTGLAAEVYNPRDLSGFAATLRASPGRHLVVGHSNTTPGLVAELGGDPHGSIDEFEYDRLYVVTIVEDVVTTELVRFGAPYLGG